MAGEHCNLDRELLVRQAGPTSHEMHLGLSLRSLLSLPPSLQAHAVGTHFVRHLGALVDALECGHEGKDATTLLPYFFGPAGHLAVTRVAAGVVCAEIAHALLLFLRLFRVGRYVKVCAISAIHLCRALLLFKSV